MKPGIFGWHASDLINLYVLNVSATEKPNRDGNKFLWCATEAVRAISASCRCTSRNAIGGSGGRMDHVAAAVDVMVIVAKGCFRRGGSCWQQ